MDYIFSMEIRDVSKLIKKAIEEKEKQNLYLMYLADRPYIKNDKGFNEYMKKAFGSKREIKIDNRSKDDIMAEIMKSG